uniref:Putative nonribosomal peptide synthetase subunit n=2 Tax=Mycobacteriales TaxID=85007 RepID=G8JYY2_RHOFA|nr:putative nonribosomal peptide synthetase subunit [Rhodococcus fascians D188]
MQPTDHSDGEQRNMSKQRMATTITSFWERALGEENLTLDDNFFDLGGDSLTAAKILALIQREYGLQAELHLIFNNPTIEEFVEAVDEELAGVAPRGEDA